jgi:hypothetical protein
MKPSPSWLLLSIPALLVSGWVLIRMIGNLVRVLRQSVVVSVPFLPSQEVNFAISGPLDLFLETPRGANLSGLDFTLQDERGDTVPLDPAVLRTTVSGVSRVRLKVRSLRLPHDGVYVLDISGLPAGGDPVNRVVFGRPLGGVIAGHVLGFIGLGLVIIGALLASIAALLPRR